MVDYLANNPDGYLKNKFKVNKEDLYNPDYDNVVVPKINRDDNIHSLLMVKP